MSLVRRWVHQVFLFYGLLYVLVLSYRRRIEETARSVKLSSKGLRSVPTHTSFVLQTPASFGSSHPAHFGWFFSPSLAFASTFLIPPTFNNAHKPHSIPQSVRDTTERLGHFIHIFSHSFFIHLAFFFFFLVYYLLTFTAQPKIRIWTLKDGEGVIRYFIAGPGRSWACVFCVVKQQDRRLSSSVS